MSRFGNEILQSWVRRWLWIVVIVAILTAGLACWAWAGSAVTVSWSPNSEEDLALYRVYLKPASADIHLAEEFPPVEVPAGTESVRITGIPDGSWRFTVTAEDKSGNESVGSEPVVKLLDSAPNQPEDVVAEVEANAPDGWAPVEVTVTYQRTTGGGQ